MEVLHNIPYVFMSSDPVVPVGRHISGRELARGGLAHRIINVAGNQSELIFFGTPLLSGKIM